jgi:enterochelin esterase-like enzyme
LPRDAYIEYAFRGDCERVPDPLSPNSTPDGFGHDNHFFCMPDAGPTPLTRHRRNVPYGTITSNVVGDEFLMVGGKRVVYVYEPPTPEACPSVPVLDGQDYRCRAKLANIVDSPISRGRIRPVALALVYHGGRARGVESACSEATFGFLLHRVQPLAQAEVNLLGIGAAPGAFVIVGASLDDLTQIALRALVFAV